MGRFIDITGHESSKSEHHCGAALAKLLPLDWVVVLHLPGPSRTTGMTADCDLYQGGGKAIGDRIRNNIENKQPMDRTNMDNLLREELKNIIRRQTTWGTVDVYSPVGGSAVFRTVKDTVRNKLSSQAKAVIVDLGAFTDLEVRNRIIAGVKSEPNLPPKTVIFKFGYDAFLHNRLGHYQPFGTRGEQWFRIG